MKKLFITLAAAAIAMLAANAEEKEKVYNFGEINSINAGFSYEINVTHGRSDKVKVVYDSEMEDLLEIKYSSTTKSLNLFVKKDIQKMFKNKSKNATRVQVYLEMKDIKSIDLSGAAKATFEGTFRTDNLDMDLSGAAGVNSLQINGMTLDADCSGAASAYITGNFTEKMEVDISGAAKMELNSNSAELDADISGASKFICDGSFNKCEIVCTGASSATIKGKAGNAEYECSGASSIDAEDFIARSVDLELTGASKAKVHATSELRHNVSRASKMTYYGNAKLVNLSNDSNIINGN